ncbi:TraU family protein [Pseudoalteromonas sp. T1lg23B]|uniref:TraU family protein n=1 Tax=Pseudoalteromonas sp. T1lg23B TaxID=2077097 RepID=UPI001F30C881|nr:TraU family protein [Pseudoalteromonas sp. T1lg23B]
MLILLSNLAVAGMEKSNGALCTDAKIFTKMLDQVCWTCMLPLRLAGVGAKGPEGSARTLPVCLCKDGNGVYKPPGVSFAYWSPRRLIETVKTSWCSPSLGGIRLQNTITGMGSKGRGNAGELDESAFYQYHYFAYPIMEMLQLFTVPDCMRDEYVDFDMLYISEIDPVHNNDWLAFVLNPESVAFANPLALVAAAADCAAITSGKANLDLFFSAGCDGLIYPMTGHVSAGGEVARNTSLVAQRALAGLHRRGLAKRTMGEDAMCKAQYSPMIPKSMYKLSAIFPISEASSGKTVSMVDRDADGKAKKNPDGSLKTIEGSLGCCHNLGESVKKWRGFSGEHIPGIGEDYVYLLFKYTDCCISSSGGGSGSE